MFCYKCGKELVPDAKFCSACGVAAQANAETAVPPAATSAVDSAPSAVQPSTADPRVKESGSLDSDQALWAAAIGKNAPYYLSRFARFEREGASRLSWNWPALFTDFLWALYRKSWAAAILFFFLPFLIAISVGALVAIAIAADALAAIGLHDHPLVYGLIIVGLPYLAGWLIPPVLANRLYYRRTKALVEDVKAAPLAISGKIALLTKRGGTGGPVFVVALVFMSVAGIGILAAKVLPAYQNYHIQAASSESSIASQPQPSQPEIIAKQAEPPHTVVPPEPQSSQPETAKQAEPLYTDTPTGPLPEKDNVSQKETGAKHGDAASQYKVGKAYIEGNGVPSNRAKALYWFEKAVEHGSVDALNYVFVIHREGDLRTKDSIREWARRGATRGNAAAQWVMGAIEEDDVVKVEWFKKAGAQGLWYAQVDLKQNYMNGRGVPQDYILAYAWGELASQSSDLSPAQLTSLIVEQSSLEARMTPTQIAEAKKLASAWTKGHILTRAATESGQPATSVESMPTPSIPKYWKNLNDGYTVEVRLDGNRLYELADDPRASIACQLEREGDRWSGTCVYHHSANPCSVTTQEIITSVTNERIEGESEGFARPQPGSQCRLVPSGKLKPFAMIPK